MTSRRFFIGPIPEGWLHGHRKSWFRSRLRFKNYTSKTLSFSIDPVTAHYNQQRSDNQSEHSTEPGVDDVALTITHTNEEPVEDEEVLAAETEDPETPSDQLREIEDPAAEELTAETDTEDEREHSPHEGDEEDDDDTPRPSTRASAHDHSLYDKGDASSSFVTARETFASSADTDRASTSTIRPNQGLGVSDTRPKSRASQNLSVPGPSNASPSANSAAPSEADSTTDLLKNRPDNKQNGKSFKGRISHMKSESKASGISRLSLEPHGPQYADGDNEEPEQEVRKRHVHGRITKKMAKLNLDDNIMDKQQRLRSRIAKTHGTISANRPHRRKRQKGEIVKAERMLVLVEETSKDALPANYGENDSLRMETRTVDRWREYLVVCRTSSHEHAPFTLQMYRTRVIPDVQNPRSRTPPHYEIRLSHRNTQVNLYSSLDKTIVVSHPCKRGTKIYIIRPKSAAHAAEWYTFIRQVLGWRRPSDLPINIPDLGVSLIFKDPFKHLEARLGLGHTDQNHTTILSQHAAEEKFAAAAIIRGCLDMLQGRPEWAEVLGAWSKTEKMGLAWKRYDRLEWVFGVNEENMYGSMAMLSSHELELRPRYHYPTAIKSPGDLCHEHKEEEPPPLEGFLIRLTSQRGIHQRRNKMFFKRLYFYTEDHHLLFCRPAKALPPPPPKLTATDESEIPSYQDIINNAPICFNVDPYPLQEGDVSWLTNGNPEYIQRHDEEAYAQAQRKAHNISQADGYIDLCKVREVRQVRWGSSSADPNIGEGPSVDFHPEPRDTLQDDGATREFDDDRTFEMALDNGLVIRLQAYDAGTRDEWIKRLEALVNYWRRRCADDAAELKAIRKRNLQLLEIDDEMESVMGQFAEKWEVKKAEASPHLHNMCLLSGCRTIKMSGQLYRKPRRHTTFARCHVVLSDGKLIIFRHGLRGSNGVQIPHIHQEHETTIDLRDCYIYSGLATESDLLYANQTFDSNNPGLHALPRVYLSSDCFTSRDEDTAITFVVWQSIRKGLFRAQEKDAQGAAKTSLRHVSALGKLGRTIVFKARSRVEKDRWVMSISSEIDRLQEENHEDIRIVSQ
ncbi:hypothetical protein N7468_009391 [Penicillium chermesinum]|uniref:PH domain-containing protein n=1 Tax=Penicillium chermesinum TaxID=63820 RepID=A0A9W9TET4_9EURO|nr:uncharacterized protein N7468_009391 [Penicillium chermesinum]KAJ5220187.1 hypothetical protein N7468_009391 [Penicillium chermesinum]